MTTIKFRELLKTVSRRLPGEAETKYQGRVLDARICVALSNSAVLKSSTGNISPK